MSMSNLLAAVNDCGQEAATLIGERVGTRHLLGFYLR